jgi:hypothetical protein
MTKNLIILFIYSVTLIAIIFLNIPYPNFIATCLTVVFWGYMVIEFNKIANRKIQGDFIVRKQTKEVRIFLVFFALYPIVGYFIDGKINFIQILLGWSILLLDIVMYFMTSRLKPIGIVIKEDNLLLNDLTKTTRNLHELKSLTFNGLTEDIIMTFKTENKMLIKSSEYLQSDIKHLILLCIEKSKEQVFLSDNLKAWIYPENCK